MSLPFQFKAVTLIKQGLISEFSLNTVKTWLITTNLPKFPEEFIALILLSCENDATSTQKKIEAYFRIKKKTPLLFNNCDTESEEMKKIFKVMYFCVIPQRLNGAVIVVSKLRDTNYRNLNIVSLLKLSLMLVTLMQISDPPEKIVAILDMKGASLMHSTCLKITPVLAHLDFVQEAFPLKIQNIHILNGGYLFRRIYAILHVYINSELKAILKVHPKNENFEEFHKEFVPASFLPMEYGGSLPSLEELTEQTMEDLKKINAFFQKEEELREA